MNIRDVKDAMDDLLEAHGCEEDYLIYTATGEPIGGFDFGDDGQLYVINSKGEIADSEVVELKAEVERLRKIKEGARLLYKQVERACGKSIPAGAFTAGRWKLMEAFDNDEKI